MTTAELSRAIEKWAGFDLDGGHLALELCNTVDWRDTPRARDWLAAPVDLIAWAARARLYTSADRDAAHRELLAAPALAARALEEAVALREALAGLLYAVVEDRDPAASDWAVFDRAVKEALSLLSLTPRSPGDAEGTPRFRLALEAGLGYLPRIRLEAARAGADLLGGSDVERVKRCGGSDCGWLFLDRTKNSSRKWCSMQGCGNREKARRHYRKIRPRA